MTLEEAPKFRVGDAVAVLAAQMPTHVRTPSYIMGARGTVVHYAGAFFDPEELAYGRVGKSRHLYRVRFLQACLWPNYVGSNRDSLDVEIYEHWLRSGMADADA